MTKTSPPIPEFPPTIKMDAEAVKPMAFTYGMMCVALVSLVQRHVFPLTLEQGIAISVFLVLIAGIAYRVVPGISVRNIIIDPEYVTIQQAEQEIEHHPLGDYFLFIGNTRKNARSKHYRYYIRLVPRTTYEKKKKMIIQAVTRDIPVPGGKTLKLTTTEETKSRDKPIDVPYLHLSTISLGQFGVPADVRRYTEAFIRQSKEPIDIMFGNEDVWWDIQSGQYMAKKKMSKT